jgi:gamma-glutamyl-gamma-aminobutyrate hydrolase PuuD
MKHLYSAVWQDDCSPFDKLEGIRTTSAVRDVEQLERDDAMLIVWGGADIDPSMYRHPMHSTTRPGGRRDQMEWSLMIRAIEKGIPIVGVCRGAQMACAAAGGFLIQDVDGHLGQHDVVTNDGKTFKVNSIHHQMMVPDDVEHELVGWSGANLSAHYGYKDDKTYLPAAGWKEPEFVYFPKIRAYAIQWHPEMMPTDSKATRYVLNYIERKEREYAAKHKKLVGPSGAGGSVTNAGSCEVFDRGCC